MALLDKGEVEETYFLIAMTIFFFEEVLDTYQRRGYAKQLLNFAKENKTN